MAAEPSVVEAFLSLGALVVEPLPLDPPATLALELNAALSSAVTTVAAVLGFLSPSFEEAPVLLGGVFATAWVGFFGFAPPVGPFLEVDALPATPLVVPTAVTGPPGEEAPAFEEGTFAAAFVDFFAVAEVRTFLELEATPGSLTLLRPFFVEVSVGSLGAVSVVGPFLELDALTAEPFPPAAVEVEFVCLPFEEEPVLLAGVLDATSVGFRRAPSVVRPFLELGLDVDACNAANLAAAPRVIPTSPPARAFLVTWLPESFDTVRRSVDAAAILPVAARVSEPLARLA